MSQSPPGFLELRPRAAGVKMPFGTDAGVYPMATPSVTATQEIFDVLAQSLPRRAIKAD